MAYDRAYVMPLTVRNLRERWPEELKNFSDDTIFNLYEHFSLSDEVGDNDARFPEWFSMLEDYAKKEKK